MNRQDSESQSRLLRSLNGYYQTVKGIVLDRQNPVTGLLPASTAVTTHGDYRDAWVRDNVYSVLCVWALALAYEKVDYDQGRTYELRQSVVKLMRGLLFCMMKQADKVERFKVTQNVADSLHAKYNTSSCETVVGDFEWGHLQLDATGLYLLTLAQMTSSGLQIIFNLDEVNFIQNLVFYIERAYRTPDFGVWERGNKLNNGQPELNSSSIGMVTAALQALNGLDLFGSRGGPDSKIYVLPDEMMRNHTVLHSLLPRESNSKEVDSALFSVLGFPAFAVTDRALLDKTLEELHSKLEGPCGFARFMLDGHQCVMEDPNRLHYEPHELRIFRDVECEWPLFFTYVIINHLFRGNLDKAKEYREKLEKTLVERELPNRFVARLVPELYRVPEDKLEEVRQNHWAEVRIPNENIPLVWAQSLMIVGDLMLDELITPSELDPLGRNFRSLREKKDTQVQIVLLSENEELQRSLSLFGLETQTLQEISPYKVHMSNNLSQLFTELGRNPKLNLSGRPNLPVHTLSTCKIYRINGVIHAFTPYFLEYTMYYTSTDNNLIVEVLKDELQFIRANWDLPGRPTLTLMLTNAMFTTTNTKQLLNLLVSLRSGTCNKVGVRVGRIKELVHTSCIDEMDFLSQNVPVNTILNPNYFPMLDPSYLKREGEQSIRSAKGPGAANRIERRKISLNFLETKKELLSLEDPKDVDETALIPTPEVKQAIENLEENIPLETCISKLRESNNIYIQIELLEHLATHKGLDFGIEGMSTVRELLEELYLSSARNQYWSVTRQASALLGKTIDNLAVAVGELLVRQKLLTIGSSGNERVISSPLSSAQLGSMIFELHGKEDVREVALVQEVLSFLGLFIRADPALFKGIVSLNIQHILTALKYEVLAEDVVNLEQAAERVFYMAPSAIKKLIHRILSLSGEIDLEYNAADFAVWREKGLLNFRPEDYVKVLMNGEGLEGMDDLFHRRKPVEIVAKSAGFLSGNFARVEVAGQVVFEMHERGVGVVVLSTTDASLVDSSTFDTHASQDESEQLARYIRSQRPEDIIVAVVKDEASANFTASAKNALETVGSLRIEELGFRGSWAFISVGAVEEVRGANDGPIEDAKAVVEVWETSTEFLRPSNGIWRLTRLLDGSLNRFPSHFFAQVHAGLARAKEGISVHKSVLPSNPTTKHMTAKERNFALCVQAWLATCSKPLERRLYVETLVAYCEVVEALPSFEINEVVVLDSILEAAAKDSWEAAVTQDGAKFEDYRALAHEFFSDLPPTGKDGTIAYLKQACISQLKLKVAAESAMVGLMA